MCIENTKECCPMCNTAHPSLESLVGRLELTFVRQVFVSHTKGSDLDLPPHTTDPGRARPQTAPHSRPPKAFDHGLVPILKRVATLGLLTVMTSFFHDDR